MKWNWMRAHESEMEPKCIIRNSNENYIFVVVAKSAESMKLLDAHDNSTPFNYVDAKSKILSR